MFFFGGWEVGRRFFLLGGWRMGRGFKFFFFFFREMRDG